MLPYTKKLILLLLCFLPSVLCAEALSAWAFYEIKISEFARVGLSQLLGYSFVADDALINDQRKVTVDLKLTNQDQAFEVLLKLLRDYGYLVVLNEKVIRIRKETPDDKEMQTVIYRPRFRTVSYLNDLLGIASNRGIRSPQGQQSPSQLIGSQGSKSSQGQNSFSAGSASSLIDRETDVLYFHGLKKEAERIKFALLHIDVPVEQLDVIAVVYEYQVSAKNKPRWVRF